MKLMQKLSKERLSVPSVRVAGAEFMLEMTIRYCKDRVCVWPPDAKFQHSSTKSLKWPQSQTGTDFLDS